MARYTRSAPKKKKQFSNNDAYTQYVLKMKREKENRTPSQISV